MPSAAARSAAYSTACRASGLRAAVMPVRCRTRGPGVQGTVHVLAAEGGAGGTGAVVEGPGDVGRPLLEEHHAGAARRRPPGAAASIPSERSCRRMYSPCGSAPTTPAQADAVAQPGDPDGHVRFRPGHVHGQAAAGGQRPGRPQRDHGLAEGQQVDGGAHRGLLRLPPAAGRRSNAGRQGHETPGPAPASGRGRRRSRRRRTAVRRARRRSRRLPSSPRLRPGPLRPRR